MIGVLVADDHQTFADLLGNALDRQPGIRYLGNARTGADTMRLVDELQPDVVLMEVALPDTDGITATEQLHSTHPQVKVVMLTARTDPALVGRATAVGAAGFLAKTGALGDVLNAVQIAHAGGMTVSSHLLAGLLRRTPAAPRTASGGLTPREHQVLRMMGGGRDARTIARTLGISVHTCRGYVKNVLAKLDAHSQLEAVAVATRRGLLTPADHD
jgi:DNA-binding NarL/FixJ family response regulator